MKTPSILYVNGSLQDSDYFYYSGHSQKHIVIISGTLMEYFSNMYMYIWPAVTHQEWPLPLFSTNIKLNQLSAINIAAKYNFYSLLLYLLVEYVLIYKSLIFSIFLGFSYNFSISLLFVCRKGSLSAEFGLPRKGDLLIFCHNRLHTHSY